MTIALHAPIHLKYFDDRRRLMLASALAPMLGCDTETATPVAQPAGSAPSRATQAVERDHRSPDLLGNAMLLPGLVESSTEGPFIKLIEGISHEYRGGRITLQALPVNRVTANVSNGVADFGFPELRLSADFDAKMPWRVSQASLGQVSFVLYTHKKRPLSKAQIQAANPKSFSYAIHAPSIPWGFPTENMVTFDGTFKMLNSGRIDGFLWAQEEADLVLQKLKLSQIRREFYAVYDDVFILPRTPRGDFVDQLLTELITKLRGNGRLQALYERVHRPYSDWQP